MIPEAMTATIVVQAANQVAPVTLAPMSTFITEEAATKHKD